MTNAIEQCDRVTIPLKNSDGSRKGVPAWQYKTFATFLHHAPYGSPWVIAAASGDGVSFGGCCFVTVEEAAAAMVEMADKNILPNLDERPGSGGIIPTERDYRLVTDIVERNNGILLLRTHHHMDDPHIAESFKRFMARLRSHEAKRL